MEQLLNKLNKNVDVIHLKFLLKTGSYVNIRPVCLNCPRKMHTFELSSTLRSILGFENMENKGRLGMHVDERHGIDGFHPANLHSHVLTNFLVYADICKPYITGDAYTRLLRNVAFDRMRFSYGGVVTKNFTQPIYVPLLCPTFGTIEIDVKISAGLPLPFDDGTLTVTLHFRKRS